MVKSPFIRSLLIYKQVASGCSTAVEHMPQDREIVCSNPSGSGAFFASLSYQKLIVNQVPHGGASLLIFLFKKYTCLAVQLEAKQA